MTKKRVLFICIHNAARSQMAEGLFRHLYSDDFDVYSAGSDLQKVDPLAIECMNEIGIDISGYRSKSLREFDGHEFEYVITVCGNLYNACPFFTGGKRYFKQPFEDPASFDGTTEEKLELFRKVRGELKDWLEDLYYSYMIPREGCCNLSEETEGCCGTTDKELSFK